VEARFHRQLRAPSMIGIDDVSLSTKLTSNAKAPSCSAKYCALATVFFNK
jgi:hypothetical protein